MEKITVTPEQKRMVLFIILTALSLILSTLGLLPEDSTIELIVPQQEPPQIYVEPAVEILPAHDPGAMAFGLTGSAGDFGDITAEGITVSGAATFNGTVSTGALSPDSLTVSGASDLQGNVSSGVGALTVTDSINVTGAATMGSLVVTGLTDLRGTISDSEGGFTVDDAVYVTGAAMLDSVVITGTLDVGGDITGENDETLSNATDTAWIIGGFLGLDEASALDLSNGDTITPTMSYQPLTVDGAATVNISGTIAIADGPIAGAILILINEDDQDIVISDGANTLLGGDITLTADADDALTLLWDGSDWVALSMHDN